MVERCDEIDAIICDEVQPQHEEISNSEVKHNDKEPSDNLPVMDIQEENRNLDLTDRERLNRFWACIRITYPSLSLGQNRWLNKINPSLSLSQHRWLNNINGKKMEHITLAAIHHPSLSLNSLR